MEMPLLEVNDFSLTFRTYERGLREKELTVIRKLNMNIKRSEIVAVVGASGSGKSLLANAILGILPEHVHTNGEIKYKGRVLERREQEKLRGKEICLIPQSVNALDPLMKTGKQVRHSIKKGNRHEIQRSIFRKVGLPIEAGEKYPFELSGGMARRVLAISAFVDNPELIIADEPTPGMDPAALQETISILKQLAGAGKGILFITHDIDTALKLADKVVVFNKGETIEEASVDAFSGTGEKLKHPFTKNLWNSMPQNKFLPIKKITNRDIQGELKAQELCYSYPQGSTLFHELSLTIKPGEIVGLHGYSGSGKTTMAKIIAGYLKPEEGRVIIDGHPSQTRGHSPVQLVWQHPEKAINPRWKLKKVLQESGMENSPLLDELGIKKEWLERWPSELSGGELQRICVARALNKHTKYLIADEMTTMLDTVTQAKIWQVVIKLARERNLGVLAISHDHALLDRISDVIVDFKDISNV
ncbi:ABC transporter ATP-binding protein [Oceanobacillus piezotolerans]|uniref:Nickel import system ATP-binding protein NikD n=1 Tax=Oceanobacillus piezotolerans TaxID=2448030 RepID=A0A498D7R7_9BACI|nr:ATP-binding cassette domain-containing protein [Oceanobacillus piezotolerans]RLL42094.1 ABC transporter ATP-binding protein [Oceanobacillus piezotolerans]